jgi:hypothetical protein
MNEYVSYEAVTDLKVKHLVELTQPDGKPKVLDFERELNALPRYDVGAIVASARALLDRLDHGRPTIGDRADLGTREHLRALLGGSA